MHLSLPERAKSAIKRPRFPYGVKIIRKGAHDWSDVRTFIPFEATLMAASRVGLSVGDYIDNVMNRIPGATQATIDQMAGLGVFADKLQTVVEIGPGSGRYLEKTLAACAPARYEIYETATLWAAYLAKRFDIILQPTDGRSLAATASNTVDLVQAHKVFSTIPFLTTARYWLEMVRVTRPGGFAVFDIVSESCMGPALLPRWASSNIDNGSYPAMIPRAVATGYFESQGFSLIGSFFIPMTPGRTETYVFRKRAAAP